MSAARRAGILKSIMWTCGIDEAGRGPLAGPVTAAAVVLPPDFPCEILNDSKKLTPARREEAAAVIRARAVACSIGWAWPEEIDRLNIHRTTLLAMRRAVLALPRRPDRLVVDGLFIPAVGIPGEAVVGGDACIPAIMAASIIAKTARDFWMVRYGQLEPGWCFEEHKGYPTVKHRELIRIHGLSAIHRRSFRWSFP